MVSSCKPDKCALSSEWRRKLPQRVNTDTRRGTNLSTGWDTVVCVTFLMWTQGWVTRWHTGGSLAHTNTTVLGVPPAVVCCWQVVVVDRFSAGRVHVVLLWTEACGWLLIPVNQRHYGDLKYFWSLYKLSFLWQHFSKLESQAKGTFMQECRRFINS